MSQDIILEIDSINKRINEMSEDLMKPKLHRAYGGDPNGNYSWSMQTQIYKGQDWDYGEDKNPNPRYNLLAEEIENCARIRGMKVG